MNLIPSWMRKLWDTWDVRLMIISSLISQIILFFLGNRRKYKVTVGIRIILWFTYLIADWIATAALGKLSESQAEPHPSNILRAVWAPLLLLHLGGPDTITAYALEDNQLWLRHLLGLVFEVVLVVYVLLLSWTWSWLSLVMNFSMFFSGILKYIERTWSLKLASSGKAEGTIPVFDIDTLVEDPKKISHDDKLVVAYQYFSAFRPDITNYISTRENLSSSGTKLIMRFMDNIQKTGLWNINMDYFILTLDTLKPADLFDIIAVQLGFLFDVLYTKAPVTFTNLGFVFRLISVSCSMCALGVFFIIIRTEPKNHYPIVDIIITSILLIAAIVVEIYALKRLLSSNWAVLWINSRNFRNRFGKRRFGELLLSIFRRKNRNWSNSVGQFNLLKYCSSYGKEERRLILGMTDIRKLWNRHRHTHHVEVLESLLLFLKEQSIDSFSSSTTTSFIATRGERALKEHGLNDLKWSAELDFDESIITWHLVTDICYHRIADMNGDIPTPVDEGDQESAKTNGKLLSDYMMYLLVMQPGMILPGYRTDFWFSHVSENISGFFEENRVLATTKVHDSYQEWYGKRKLRLREALELEQNAWTIAERLNQRNEEKWKIIVSVWSEILSYAAIACPHVNHAQQLRRGGELLTHLWLMLTMSFLRDT